MIMSPTSFRNYFLTDTNYRYVIVHYQYFVTVLNLLHYSFQASFVMVSFASVYYRRIVFSIFLFYISQLALYKRFFLCCFLVTVVNCSISIYFFFYSVTVRNRTLASIIISLHFPLSLTIDIHRFILSKLSASLATGSIQRFLGLPTGPCLLYTSRCV